MESNRFDMLIALLVLVAFICGLWIGGVMWRESERNKAALNAVEHGCAVVKDGKIEWREEGR